MLMLVDFALPLKRDRENCTVFVSDLPLNAGEQDLTALFKDVSYPLIESTYEC